MERVIVLLRFEQKFSLVGLNTHAQEAAILLLTPSNDVLAESDKLLVPPLNFNTLVEERASHLGQLGLGEIDIEWQDGLSEVDELLDQALFFIDRCQAVSRLLLASNRFICEVINRWELLLDDLLV